MSCFTSYCLGSQICHGCAYSYTHICSFRLIVTPRLEMPCIQLAILSLFIALRQVSLAQSLTVNGSLVVFNGFTFTSQANSVPTPPPCTIQTSVCTSSSEPHWVPDPIPTHPENYFKHNCSVSYVNGAGLWNFPVIRPLPGRNQVPCGAGTVMTFGTRLGTGFVVYEGAFEGVPDYPLMG